MAGRNDPPSAQHADATLIVGFIVVIGTFILLWWKAKPVFVYSAFAIDWAELKIAGFFGNDGSLEALKRRVEGHFTGYYDPWQMTFAEYYRIAEGVGTRVRAGLVLAMMGLTALVYFRMKGDNFKREISLDSLMHIQAEYWKTLSPSAAFNVDKEDPSMDPPRTPFEWLWDSKVNARDCKLDQKACAEALKKQLGPSWHGIKELGLHAQCVAILAAAHGMEGVRSNRPLELRQKIAVAYATKPPGERDKDLRALIAPWLANKALVEKVDGLASKHAYVTTALMRVLKWARDEGGVLPTAEFLWIKGLDRNLFYALNNVGRRAFHVEGVGSMAHYDAENVAQTAMLEPHVDEAVKGVQDYLNHHGTDPETVLKKKLD